MSQAGGLPNQSEHDLLRGRVELMNIQGVRQEAAWKVKKIYDADPTGRKRIVVRTVSGQQMAFFKDLGDGASGIVYGLDEALEIVDNCHPRWLEGLNIAFANLSDKINARSTPNGLLVDDKYANPYITNILTAGKASATMDEKLVLASVLANPSLGAKHILTFTPDEQKDALRGMGMTEERLVEHSDYVIQLLAHSELQRSLIKVIGRRYEAIEKIRKDAGVPDNNKRKREFWTDERIADQDTNTFCSMGVIEQLDTAPLVPIVSAIRTQWSSLTDGEKGIYQDVLGGTANIAIETSILYDEAVRRMTLEMGLFDRGDEAYRKYMADMHLVAPESESFRQQLTVARSSSKAYLATDDLREQWGDGKRKIRLGNSIRAFLPELPSEIKPKESSLRVLRNSDTDLKNYEDYQTRSMLFHRAVPGFIDWIAALDDSNHDLATACWRCVKPANENDHQYNDWAVQILVAGTFHSKEASETPRDYTGEFRKLMEANASKPFMPDYVRAVTSKERPKDYAVFDALLSQRFIDLYLNDLPLDNARGMLFVMQFDDERRILTPTNEKGSRLLADVVSTPSLLDPFHPGYWNSLTREFAKGYLGCLTDPPHNERLRSVADRPYYAMYTFAYVNIDDESRDRFSSQGCVQMLDTLKDRNPEGVDSYFNMIANAETRPTILSDNVQGLITGSPIVATHLGMVHDAGHLGELCPHLMSPANTDFFDDEHLSVFADRARDGQWAVAQAALKHLNA